MGLSGALLKSQQVREQKFGRTNEHMRSLRESARANVSPLVEAPQTLEEEDHSSPLKPAAGQSQFVKSANRYNTVPTVPAADEVTFNDKVQGEEDDTLEKKALEPKAPTMLVEMR